MNRKLLVCVGILTAADPVHGQKVYSIDPAAVVEKARERDRTAPMCGNAIWDG